MNKVTANIREPKKLSAQFGGVKIIDRGEGTTDYDKLTNKPTLNGVEIIGDKISEDYKLPPQMWFGTRTEYNALPVIYPDICYFIEEGT